jgi:two-component system nitrate/nitrite response regulator NarL
VSAEPDRIVSIEIDNDHAAGMEIASSAASPRVSLLVATRNRILGEALGEVLSRTGYEVHLAPQDCGPAAIVIEARAIRPALVLLDLPTRFPTTALAEAIAELGRHRVRVILLGPDASLPNWAIDIPVDGWASRSDPLSSLVDTVQQTAPIGAPLRPWDLDQDPTPVLSVRAPGQPTHKSGFELLTYREQQVLKALMDGTPPVKIARQLFMSPSTVRHHIRSILLKLNVNSQLAAVVAAYQAGWPSALRPSPRTGPGFVEAQVQDLFA